MHQPRSWYLPPACLRNWYSIPFCFGLVETGTYHLRVFETGRVCDSFLVSSKPVKYVVFLFGLVETKQESISILIQFRYTIVSISM